MIIDTLLRHLAMNENNYNEILKFQYIHIFKHILISKFIYQQKQSQKSNS